VEAQGGISMSSSGQERAQNQRSKFQQLLDLTGAISRAQEPPEIYKAVTQTLVRALAADRAAVLLFDRDDKLRFEEWVGLSDEYRNAMEGHTYWQRGARDAQPIAVSDVTQDSFHSARVRDYAKEGIRAAAFFPLIGSGGVMGGIILYYNTPHEFQSDQLQITELIASQVSLAVERHCAQTALRQSEERFHSTFQLAAVGIAQTNPQGGWLLLNNRFCEIVGYTQAELLGKTFLDITHPGDRDAELDGRRKLLTGEITLHSMDKRYADQNGTTVWARQYLSLARDRGNLPQYFTVVIEDITKNVAEEHALRQSELWNKQICDNIPTCIFLLDVTNDGRFKFVTLNPAEEKAIGFASAEVSGRFIEDVLTEEVSTKVIVNYRRCLESGPISYEDELNLEAGRRYFHTNLIPLRDASGRVHRIAGCCTDLTEVKRTQETNLARQKLESIGVLASGIAHDFNNLLGGILSCTELALTECADPSPVWEQLQRIRTASMRGAEIVRELMIYSGQDDSGPLDTVDLSRLVEEMLELLKFSISKKTVLSADLHPDLPLVLGRASQIRQIVMNLVINASEAIDDRDGIIKVATSRTLLPGDFGPNGPLDLPAGDYLKLEVSDTGGGMTKEVQAKIFDPFFSTKFAGRGLGLAVVQVIVRDHGGAIKLVSALRQGTKFEIFLPCAGKTAQSSHGAHKQASGREHSFPSGTVLVVEDEEMLRRAVSQMLRKSGFGVIEASDGSSALELVRAHKDEINVMLLDVTLPGASSREVLEEARHLRPNLKVILTSAYSRETIHVSFAGLRIERYLRKPFQLADLISLIQQALLA